MSESIDLIELLSKLIKQEEEKKETIPGSVESVPS